MSNRLHMNTVDSHLSPLSFVFLRDTNHPKGAVSYLSGDSCSSFARGPTPPSPPLFIRYMISCRLVRASLSLIILNYLPLITNLGFWKNNHYCRYQEPGTTLDHSENTLSTTGQQRIRSYRTSKLVPRDAHLKGLLLTYNASSQLGALIVLQSESTGEERREVTCSLHIIHESKGSQAPRPQTHIGLWAPNVNFSHQVGISVSAKQFKDIAVFIPWWGTRTMPQGCIIVSFDCSSQVSHTLPSSISKSFNLLIGTQERSWRLNEACFL